MPYKTYYLPVIRVLFYLTFYGCKEAVQEEKDSFRVLKPIACDTTIHREFVAEILSGHTGDIDPCAGY